MNGFTDLHCHSTASDGTLAPAAVAQLAAGAELAAWSLTDHDTIAGLAEAQAASQQLGLAFLPGIEISCQYPAPGTMHLLGYGVRPDSPVLQKLTQTLIDARDNRNPRIIAKLNELGVAVTMEQWEQEAGGKVVGRPHLAAILFRMGYVSSIKQAFDKYLGQGSCCYVDKERLEPQKAFEMIHQSGGLPVLAHPVQLRTENDGQLERLVKDFLDLGLAGIEVMHSDHSPQQIEKYSLLADRCGLLKTGGSDFHGGNKKDINLGYCRGRRVPGEFYGQLMIRLG